ncbi:MAG TPA: hypothetical protein VEA37_12195 [Flavobacterium sp.]|nr:hypothetical protein [Flavobacterium sp.]
MKSKLLTKIEELTLFGYEVRFLTRPVGILVNLVKRGDGNITQASNIVEKSCDDIVLYVLDKQFTEIERRLEIRPGDLLRKMNEIYDREWHTKDKRPKECRMPPDYYRKLFLLLCSDHDIAIDDSLKWNGLQLISDENEKTIKFYE